MNLEFYSISWEELLVCIKKLETESKETKCWKKDSNNALGFVWICVGQ